jgi:hypothetical protein
VGLTPSGGYLGLRRAFNQGNDVGDGHESLCFLFGNIEAKLVLERKPNVNQVQAVGSKILDELRAAQYRAIFSVVT